MPSRRMLVFFVPMMLVPVLTFAWLCLFVLAAMQGGHMPFLPGAALVALLLAIDLLFLLLLWYLALAILGQVADWDTFLQVHPHGGRAFYILLIPLVLTPLLAFGWLLGDTIRRIAAGQSGDYIGVVILAVLLLLLGPMLLILAWKCVQTAAGWEGPQAAQALAWFQVGDGGYWGWISFVGIVFDIALIIIALVSFSLGNYLVGFVTGLAAIGRALQTFSGLTPAGRLRVAGGALTVLGLVWLGPVLQGLSGGDQRLVLGGAILWLVFTAPGVFLLRRSW
ncbi:MAG: hypothetical protein EXR62_02555 [Chloroflexi bacterium]|nr:hypothetical protein [Chloroflexota bacterium]